MRKMTDTDSADTMEQPSTNPFRVDSAFWENVGPPRFSHSLAPSTGSATTAGASAHVRGIIESKEREELAHTNSYVELPHHRTSQILLAPALVDLARAYKHHANPGKAQQTLQELETLAPNHPE